ncbi:peroxiredoxin family protein [Mariniphaga sediminis]|uniref:peroxiredoxin family protein n=1 Tax=Mariniphaga sediminis TaxID=1628158 RepID=UPI0035637CA2
MKFEYRIPLVAILLIGTLFAKAQNPVDFELSSATDKSRFVLSEAKGKFVALHFLLKTECPYCLLHTHDYLSKAASLPNVIQVFIKPDTEEEIEEWAKGLPEEELAQFPIFRDPEAKLAAQFNIPDGYGFHNQFVHYPALILLGPDGKEVFRYIGKNNTDRYPFEKFKIKVQELSQ